MTDFKCIMDTGMTIFIILVFAGVVIALLIAGFLGLKDKWKDYKKTKSKKIMILEDAKSAGLWSLKVAGFIAACAGLIVALGGFVYGLGYVAYLLGYGSCIAG